MALFGLVLSGGAGSPSEPMHGITEKQCWSAFLSQPRDTHAALLSVGLDTLTAFF